MFPLNICFSLKSSRLGPSYEDNFKRDYETLYKPLVKFLYTHPGFKFSFNLNGPQLEFYKKQYPEFIEIIRQFISRKQVEIIGGGYYDPVFPLLFPMDRTGQIEKLTTEMRELFGKRPRGINICGSIWDYSLITTFNTCGLDYVLLDESLIPSDKQNFLPFIMSDKGKSLTILPIYRSLKPATQTDVDEFIENLLKLSKKHSKSQNIYFNESERLINIQFSTDEFSSLLEDNWIECLVDKVENMNELVFSLPFSILKKIETRNPIYIASGMSSEISQWGIKTYESVKLDKRYPITIYDFFQIYPQSKALFDRMLFISMLVNQSHGDKMRKIAAREKLWAAQNGDGFICTSKGAFVSSTYRQQAYKLLTETEKILRECKPFEESFYPYDYTGNGLKEYIFRMKKYFAVVSKKGGALKELDVFQNSGNYADNLSRINEFEGSDDNYERGLFVDHLFDDDEFRAYLNNKPISEGIFSKYIYKEIKMSDQHNEITFFCKALYKNKQLVSLKKKYVANSNGMMVQYILKNESDIELNAKFAIESSFAQTNFNALDFNAFKLEILSDSSKKEIDTKSSSYALNESGTLTDVEGVWITDTDNNITFVFEPNEACELSFVPIVFSRPESVSGKLVPASMTFASAMFWDIQLPGGMEMEKTINFTIYNQKKKVKK